MSRVAAAKDKVRKIDPAAPRGKAAGVVAVGRVPSTPAATVALQPVGTRELSWWFAPT
jgi:hypothetical protein